MGFESTVPPFMLHKTYAPLVALSLQERRAAIANPDVRRAILAETLDHDQFDGVLAVISIRRASRSANC
jgi:hypothetical protein